MAREVSKQPIAPAEEINLIWHSAAYGFHSYAYRDPRSAFASGIGLPVVSPTTVLLGIVATLFSIGEVDAARNLLPILHQCEVIVDAPDGVIFFRAFHQIRRYRTMKWGPDPRYGFTTINQGTREYGLVDGTMILYVGVPEEHVTTLSAALLNLRHIGTSDSLCSLIGSVESCEKPKDVIYMPISEFATSGIARPATVVTLSRFHRKQTVNQTLPHWKMAGDASDTELVPYVIPGSFLGTTRGRVYRKRQNAN